MVEVGPICQGNNVLNVFCGNIGSAMTQFNYRNAMNVLILTHGQYITVGLPKVIEFSEAVAGLGHDVTLCATSKTKRFGVVEHYKNGIKILEFPSLLMGRLRHGADPFDALNRILFLRNRSFDLIHCFGSRPTVYYPGICQKKKDNAVLILEWEDSFSEGGVALARGGALYYRLFGWIEKYFEEAIIPHADGVLVVSDYLMKRALKLGANLDSIRKQIKGTKFIDKTFPKKSEVRKVISNCDEKTTILTYVGSIYESDLQLLMRAIEISSTFHPDMRVHLVGFNRQPPKITPLNVKIFSRIPEDDYIRHLAASDLFLLPLRNSTANISRYPSKFGDYLAVGRPVIATPHPEIKRMIELGKFGYVSLDDTVQSFSETIIKAIEDRKNWPTLGKNANNYAKNNLAWDVIARECLSFYGKISYMRP